MESTNKEKKALIELLEKNDPCLKLKHIISRNTGLTKSFKRVIKEDEPTDYVKCDNCPTIVKYNSRLGTGGLKRHKCSGDLKNESAVREKPPEQLKTSETSLPKLKLKSDLTDSLVLFIAKDMRPLNIINGDGFQLMAQKLLDIGSKNPNIELKTILPTDRSLSNHIKPVYDRIKSKVIEVFNKIETIGITCDHWTKSKTTYITLTIHYIKDCGLKSRVLTTIATTDKTASVEMDPILSEFNLNDKNRYFTIDNESANVLALNYEKWITCAAQNINLLHKNSFHSLQEESNGYSINGLIKESKKLVTYLKQPGIQTGLKSKLKQSFDSRWDTTYLMLESIETNLTELRDLSLTDPKVWEISVNIDQRILSELITFLKPFYEMRLDLCKENKPTLHMVLPTKHKMLSLCMDCANDSYYIRNLKTTYKTNIEKYFKISDYHKIATILYPSLKNSNRLFTAQERFEVIQKMSYMLGEIQTSIVARHNQTATECLPEVDLCLQDLVQANDLRDLNISDDELNAYLNGVQSFALNSSILHFWEVNKSKFPRLNKLAIQLLSIPATNISNERNFTAADLPLNDPRSNFNLASFNHLLFIKSNFDLY